MKVTVAGTTLRAHTGAYSFHGWCLDPDGMTYASDEQALSAARVAIIQYMGAEAAVQQPAERVPLAVERYAGLVIQAAKRRPTTLMGRITELRNRMWAR